MPIFKEGQTIGWSQFLVAEDETYGRDCVLHSTGLTPDTYGNIVAYPGTVVAKVTGSHLSTYQTCLVKVAAPTYGPGTDVAYGLLGALADLTKGPKVVNLVRAGVVRESLVTDEGTFGTVQATTKTELAKIEWV